MLRRNPPKLQSSFAKASEDTRIPPRSGDRGFLRRRVNNPGLMILPERLLELYVTLNGQIPWHASSHLPKSLCLCVKDVLARLLAREHCLFVDRLVN